MTMQLPVPSAVRPFKLIGELMNNSFARARNAFRVAALGNLAQSWDVHLMSGVPVTYPPTFGVLAGTFPTLAEMASIISVPIAALLRALWRWPIFVRLALASRGIDAPGPARHRAGERNQPKGGMPCCRGKTTRS